MNKGGNASQRLELLMNEAARMEMRVIQSVNSQRKIYYFTRGEMKKTGPVAPRHGGGNTSSVYVQERDVVPPSHGLLAARELFLQAGDVIVFNHLEPPPVEVPRNGELLLWFVCRNRDVREALLGDMEEDFTALVIKRGRKTAVVWYWWMVARSAMPLLWDAFLRAVAAKAILKKIGL